MRASSMKASLLSLDGSQKRECYVAAPAPKIIKKHRDLWKHAWNSDLELPSYSDDVLFFSLQEVCEIPRAASAAWATPLEPECLAIYREVPKETAQAMVAMEAQKAAMEAQLAALSKAAAQKATEEMLAQQAAQANLAGWASKPQKPQKPVGPVEAPSWAKPWSEGGLGWNQPTVTTNTTNAEPPELVAPPKPDPLESQIPDPQIPKRRMMKK